MAGFRKTVSVPELAGLPKVIEKIEKALGKLGKATEDTSKKTAEFNETQKKAFEFSEKTKRFYNEAGKEVNRLGEEVNRANKRTTMLNNAINTLGKQGKNFEFLSVKTFKAYKEQGGNALEYVAEFLTNSREELRFFGLEVAKFKRFIFGFIPGGFAVINRFGLTLQVLGGTIRALKTDANSTLEETGKKAGMTAKSLKKVFGVLGKRRSKGLTVEKSNLLFPTDYDIPDKQQNLTDDLFKPMMKKSKERLMGFIDKADTIFQKSKEVVKDQFKGMAANRNLVPILDKDGYKTGKFREDNDEQDMVNYKIQEKELTITPLMKLQFEIATRWKKLKLGTRLKNGLNTLKMIGKKVALFFLSFLAIATLAFVVIKAIGPTIQGTAKKAYEVFKVGLGVIMGALTIIWDSAKLIWNSVFGDGDLGTFIAGLIGLAWGILQLGIGILIAFGGPLLTFLLETGKNILITVKDKLTQVIKGSKSALIFALLVGFVAWWFTAPVWLIGGLVIVAYKLIKDGIPMLMKALKDATFKTASVKRFLGRRKDAIMEGNVKKFFGLAGGGTTSGGINLVGELGPELVKLPAGSRVYPTGQSQRMMGTTNNINITINARDTSKAEMDKIARVIGDTVIARINRRQPINRVVRTIRGAL